MGTGGGGGVATGGVTTEGMGVATGGVTTGGGGVEVDNGAPVDPPLNVPEGGGGVTTAGVTDAGVGCDVTGFGVHDMPKSGHAKSDAHNVPRVTKKQPIKSKIMTEVLILININSFFYTFNFIPFLT